jgi:hypothetical protein
MKTAKYPLWFSGGRMRRTIYSYLSESNLMGRCIRLFHMGFVC